MGLFKRNSRPDSIAAEPEHLDLGTLVLQGEDMIDQLARAHTSWGLGSADRWGLDQPTGIITWTFPDKTATVACTTGCRIRPARTALAGCAEPVSTRDGAAHSSWSVLGTQGSAHDRSPFDQHTGDVGRRVPALLGSWSGVRVLRDRGGAEAGGGGGYGCYGDDAKEGAGG